MSRARTLAGAIGSDGALNVADVAGLAAVASSGSASDLTTGTLPIARVSDGSVTAAKLHTTAVTDKLGYTPLNKAGDTLSGTFETGQSVFNFGNSSYGGKLRYQDNTAGDHYWFLDTIHGGVTTRRKLIHAQYNYEVTGSDRLSWGANYKNSQKIVWQGVKGNGTITLANITLAEIPVAATIYMTAFKSAQGVTRTYMASAIYALQWVTNNTGGSRGTGEDGYISWSVSAGSLVISLTTSGFSSNHSYTVVLDGMVGATTDFPGNDQWIA